MYSYWWYLFSKNIIRQNGLNKNLKELRGLIVKGIIFNVNEMKCTWLYFIDDEFQH